MDTTATRKQIGFPSRRAEWAKAPAVFGEHNLRIAAHPVMEDWEAGYMSKLATVACLNGGKVLEVGYGLGLSARAIQSHAVESHFIIECHPHVIAKCLSDFHDPICEGRLHVISGFWQEVTPLIAAKMFDGILFDTYPLCAGEIHRNHFDFFAEAYRLLKVGGTLTYYSDEATTLSDQHITLLQQAGFSRGNIHYEICKVDPPNECEYWQHKTIIVPIIEK